MGLWTIAGWATLPKGRLVYGAGAVRDRYPALPLLFSFTNERAVIASANKRRWK